ncbi:hypothetical protein JQC92_12015 [Shewanella sp. 202IG2-18]|uniref:DUF6776 family protein n=1 Tax=Parashewanella hymeniacidonis TaxID=2807618 RepID=UPI0019619836|nr:DUF6776 family protein [Parashewanella hymeniacidonis]MBM7072749.1 hypothetical protein [Parashewanella hymeniacidonis]
MVNYERWRNRLQVIERNYLPINRYLFIVVIISFLIGALGYHAYQDVLPVKVKKSAQLEKLKQENSNHLQDLASKNLEITLEKQANANMEIMFVEQRNKLKDLERELAFYRSIMAPEKAAQGVSIHDLTFEPSIVDGQHDLTLILTQQKKRRRSLAGFAELTLIGVKDGKEVTQSINKLVANEFKFKFRFFQMLEARLSLPVGTDWKEVQVKVKVPATRWSSAEETERTFDLKKLLADETQQAIEEYMKKQQKGVEQVTKGEVPAS